MRVLTDEDLVPLIEDVTKPLIKPVPSPQNWFSRDSPVQPSSIDFHVGELYSPGRKGDASGSPVPLGEKFVLRAGETVVIRTLETICLTPKLCGFGFPPSRVSSQGILMTNPGHLDPGYQGAVHLTAINMGSEPYELRRGDPIVTIVIFELQKAPRADFGVRYTNSPSHITQAQLDRLSADFVNVTMRAEEIANRAVDRADISIKKAQQRAAWIGTAVTGALALFTLFWNSKSNIDLLNQNYASLEKRTDEKLATNKQVEDIEAQIVRLQQQLADLAENQKRK